MANIHSQAENFFNTWRSGKIHFAITSSGSTGAPKTIELSRKAMTASAEITGQFLGVSSKDGIFCCLPLNKVGGLMQLVRSEVWNVPIVIQEPSTNPLLNAPENATIASFTPMQLHHILSNPVSTQNLQKFRIVLVGGSGIDNVLETQLAGMKPAFYHTYGMSETCSHIALRRLGKELRFKVLPGVQLQLNSNGCLCIRGAQTDNLWVETTDLAQIKEDSLVILGRADFVINSGGVKLFPEAIEKTIIDHFSLPEGAIVVCGIPDPVLGQKAALVVDSQLVSQKLGDFSFMENKHEIPKNIYYSDVFYRTETFKPDRKKNQDWAIQMAQAQQ